MNFEVAWASSFSGTGYDLAARSDCLHDTGDPLAAARHIRQALKPNGTWLVVEPAAADDAAGNMNPVGRVYYSFSTMLCVPNAISQPGGYTLGAQAGEAAIRQVVAEAGFTRFRRAAENTVQPRLRGPPLGADTSQPHHTERSFGTPSPTCLPITTSVHNGGDARVREGPG